MTVRPELFLTPSDVLRALNKSLDELEGIPNKSSNHVGKNDCQGGDDQRNNCSSSTGEDCGQHGNVSSVSTTTATTATTKKAAARFELQRRLPDGSTRRATTEEMAAHDVQTQIQQAIQHITTTFTTDKERGEWAEVQRIMGNQYYQKGDYEQAITVYLTCLPAVVAGTESFQLLQTKYDWNHHLEEEYDEGSVGDCSPLVSTSTLAVAENHRDDSLLLDVVPHTATATNTTNTITRTNSEDIELCKSRLLLFMKIMNNLAQSALKMRWNRKADNFVSLAIDYLTEHKHTTSLLESSEEYQEQLSKLYYRRGKARRLRGEYKQSRNDLQWAISCPILPDLRRPIEYELHLLQSSVEKARKNKQQQKKSLQQVMSSSRGEISMKDDGTATPSTTVGNCIARRISDADSDTSQQRDSSRVIVKELNFHKHQKREYSNLRAPPRKLHTNLQHPSETEEEQEEKESFTLSYWQYYLVLIGNGAKAILEWIGDDDDCDDDDGGGASHSHRKYD